MKKEYLVILIVLVLGFGIGICVDKLLFDNRQDIEENKAVVSVKNTNVLSMMLETEANSGKYILEERSSWPTKEEGYIFNVTLSKCENGSKLRWDEDNNAVIVQTNVSDKCFVYFDVYVESSRLASCNDNTLACWVAKQYNEVQGANNLYYHDSTLENGANDNSYRYAGSSDTTNNFVCFGSDAATCPDDNLYRIIGVFGDQVKLIKWDYATTALLGTNGDSNGACSANVSCVYGINKGYYKGSNTAANIGAYWWNYDGTDYGTNTWSVSELNTVNLNTNFLNNIGSKWSSKIANTTWKVGGSTQYMFGYYVTPSNAYKYEYTNPAESTTVNTKVGLMYTSDYGFAASPSAWTSTLDSYDSSSITNVNWMCMGLNDWTVVRLSDYSDVAFYVKLYGKVESICVGDSNKALAVRPVFYLESSVNYVSGDGTKNSPIRLS